MRKIKRITIVVMLLLFLLLMAFFIITADEDERPTPDQVGMVGLNLSEEVLAYQGIVAQYAEENGLSEYIQYLLAIMQVESGGKGNDVMQCSESLGMKKDSLLPEESIKQGCAYFAKLLKAALDAECDVNTAVQAYNYGGKYVEYVAANGKVHTFELAENFAKEKSKGKKVPYNAAIAVQTNGGWRYHYGNMFYVYLVSQYLYVPEFTDETVTIIMTEALKYQGWKYVFGGSNPDTSFDCSGLVQWCFGKAGIMLPRTAQQQYDSMQHIALSEASPGDLVFFTGTYDSGTYITHVGIYVGDNRMYHAGNPIGYADLTTEYWQKHIVCAGRIKEAGGE